MMSIKYIEVPVYVGNDEHFKLIDSGLESNIDNMFMKNYLFQHNQIHAIRKSRMFEEDCVSFTSDGVTYSTDYTIDELVLLIGGPEKRKDVAFSVN